jgi:alkylmercury lyase
MQTESLNIPALAAEFAAARPDLDLSQQRLALATYRLLGEGEPVRPEELAERTGLPVEEVDSRLEEWMAHRDEEGRVIGFGGLTLKPTAYLLEVDGRTLYAWCALDTLFLPERLGRPARIHSSSPQSGETISLTVDAAGVHDLAPEGAAMTLHQVSELDELKDVIGTFCRYVHFFAFEQEARAWAERSEGTYVTSIADGFEYGRLYNRTRLGAALEESRA